MYCVPLYTQYRWCFKVRDNFGCTHLNTRFVLATLSPVCRPSLALTFIIVVVSSTCSTDGMNLAQNEFNIKQTPIKMEIQLQNPISYSNVVSLGVNFQ